VHAAPRRPVSNIHWRPAVHMGRVRPRRRRLRPGKMHRGPSQSREHRRLHRPRSVRTAELSGNTACQGHQHLVAAVKSSPGGVTAWCAGVRWRPGAVCRLAGMTSSIRSLFRRYGPNGRRPGRARARTRAACTCPTPRPWPGSWVNGPPRPGGAGFAYPVPAPSRPGFSPSCKPVQYADRRTCRRLRPVGPVTEIRGKGRTIPAGQGGGLTCWRPFTKRSERWLCRSL